MGLLAPLHLGRSRSGTRRGDAHAGEPPVAFRRLPQPRERPQPHNTTTVGGRRGRGVGVVDVMVCDYVGLSGPRLRAWQQPDLEVHVYNTNTHLSTPLHARIRAVQTRPWCSRRGAH